MTLDNGLVLGLGSGVLSVLSLIGHAQLKLISVITKMDKDQAIFQAQEKSDLAAISTRLDGEAGALRRHLIRNEEDTKFCKQWIAENPKE